MKKNQQNKQKSRTFYFGCYLLQTNKKNIKYMNWFPILSQENISSSVICCPP